MYLTTKNEFQITLADIVTQVVKTKQYEEPILSNELMEGYKLTVLPEDVKVGDKVYSEFYGKGEIVELLTEEKLRKLSEEWGLNLLPYFIVVKFEGGWLTRPAYDKHGFTDPNKNHSTRIFLIQY